ncbi:hypothetical protein RI367_001979 [Sorochytrium milnesiophthora]
MSSVREDTGERRRSFAGDGDGVSHSADRVADDKERLPPLPMSPQRAVTMMVDGVLSTPRKDSSADEADERGRITFGAMLYDESLIAGWQTGENQAARIKTKGPAAYTRRPASSTPFTKIPNRPTFLNVAPPTIDFRAEHTRSLAHVPAMYNEHGVGKKTGVLWESRALAVSRCNGIADEPPGKERPRRFRVTTVLSSPQPLSGDTVPPPIDSGCLASFYQLLAHDKLPRHRDTLIVTEQKIPSAPAGAQWAARPTRFGANAAAWAHDSSQVIVPSPDSPAFCPEERRLSRAAFHDDRADRERKQHQARLETMRQCAR